MTNILIPYTFVAGTKAKAEEVNANFQTLKSAVETTNTSITALSSATDTKMGTLTNLTTADKTSVVSAINELNEKRPLSAFCINAGYINSSNEAELLSASSSSLSFKIDDGATYGPLKATTAAGESFELTSLNPIDMSEFADGTYNVFVGSNSSIAYANTIYRQKTAPASPSLNDVWLKTLEPLSAFKYSGTEWEIFSLVPIGQATVASGVITAIKQPWLNINGARREEVYSYVNGTSWYTLYSDGWIEQGGYVAVGNESTTITLLKPYSNTNYTLITTVQTNYHGSASIFWCAPKNITSSSFQITQDTTYCPAHFWRACGY